MSAAVDRIAQAMLPTLGESNLPLAMALARDAIAAWRDPTEAEFAEASVAALFKGQYQGYSYSGGIWRAMHDLALEDTP